MAELIKFEVKELPKLCVIGKELRYNMEELMKGNNPIGPFWTKCFADNIFAELEKQEQFIFDKAYVGFMSEWDNSDGNSSYICGIMFKEGAVVPDGFVMKEIQPTKAAVSWIRGKDTADVCIGAHEMTEKAISENGQSSEGLTWCMELYNCPRFTNPDENGEIILDYYIPIK